MTWYVIHIVDLLLWLTMAFSIVYIVFFALASLSGHAKKRRHADARPAKFLVLYPAYHEDAVITHSVEQFLQQDYPADRYQVVVISDHMTDETNARLRSFPVTVLTPSFEKSSKAKALQHAIEEQGARGKEQEAFDFVAILDADNVVEPDFLTRLNEVCHQGYKAIQCHRCAKNSDNDVAVLDGVSEEINNTIFRKAHNVVGLSSALIGSGMCFDYQWFANNVHALSSAVEDRELETLLAQQKVFVKYVEDIHVFDEKVSNADNFQRQRLRWMTGQVQSLVLMLPYIPRAIVTGNINYIDKTVQQALIPRSILIVLTALLCMVSTVVSLLFIHSWLFTVKWWCLFFMLCVSLLIAMPAQMRTHAVIGRLTSLPGLVWRMMSNVAKIDHKNKEFIHTTHTK
ncbi:MAG: glycosyltransferase family 2 protein [Prevotella sp.]|nr:glycosyltransferase family 2 protein [Prevotella sp.]